MGFNQSQASYLFIYLFILKKKPVHDWLEAPTFWHITRPFCCLTKVLIFFFITGPFVPFTLGHVASQFPNRENALPNSQMHNFLISIVLHFGYWARAFE
jgi:predicted PurR-regulated permease PerM